MSFIHWSACQFTSISWKYVSFFFLILKEILFNRFSLTSHLGECSDADELSSVTSCPNTIAPDAPLYTLYRSEYYYYDCYCCCINIQQIDDEVKGPYALERKRKIKERRILFALLFLFDNIFISIIILIKFRQYRTSIMSYSTTIFIDKFNKRWFIMHWTIITFTY
jgi:hypothetical protein